MILTHGANSLPRGSSDPDVIGGRKYRTVTIGEQTWLAENLDFKFPGLTIRAEYGSTDVPQANYYNNDEQTYGVSGNKYGLLYNGAAVEYLEAHKSRMIPGWHVPTTEEWDTLIRYYGGGSYFVTDLKAKSPDWNGSDRYGFSALPSGMCSPGSQAVLSFSDLGEYAYFCTKTRDPNQAGNIYHARFKNQGSITSWPMDREFSLRLVRDA